MKEKGIQRLETPKFKILLPLTIVYVAFCCHSKTYIRRLSLCRAQKLSEKEIVMSENRQST